MPLGFVGVSSLPLRPALLARAPAPSNNHSPTALTLRLAVFLSSPSLLRVRLSAHEMGVFQRSCQFWGQFAGIGKVVLVGTYPLT